MNNLLPLIISRHVGTVAWLATRGITGEVVAHATPEQVRGRIVVGVLPLSLASLAAEVWSVDLPSLPQELRGQELDLVQMAQAGACLQKYKVERL